MLFNSLHFLAFFPVITGLFFLVPGQRRWMLLLAASCYFYMVFKPVYILILLLTISVDYYAAIKISRSEGRQKKRWLIVSIVSTVLILCVFKYIDFFILNYNLFSWNFLHQEPVPLLEIVLPIGLSFHTFQSLSYVIEVYKGKQIPEKHFGIYSLYVMFYPQLIAGPIERPQRLLHQFRENHPFNLPVIKQGLLLMLWGFFKKVCIADRLAPYVDDVYTNPTGATGPEALLALYFYAFQIYCDFSGYSDIAIGSARAMGFNLMQNFDRPYAAISLSDFWKRWHISLSSWFRDYIYIPLGGNRKGIARQCINLMLTFIISGLWHGAGWNFVAWGALHGILLIGEYLLGMNKKLPASPLSKAIRTLLVFHLVVFAWVFFRAHEMKQAFDVIGALAHRWPAKMPFGQGFETMMDLLPALPLLGILLYMEWKHGSNPLLHWQQNRPIALRWSMVWLVIFIILNFGAFTKGQSFIYFQF